jgi:hypothetical protein
MTNWVVSHLMWKMQGRILPVGWLHPSRPPEGGHRRNAPWERIPDWMGGGMTAARARSASWRKRDRESNTGLNTGGRAARHLGGPSPACARAQIGYRRPSLMCDALTTLGGGTLGHVYTQERLEQ